MLSALLDKVGTHQRQTSVKDSTGGNVPIWATQTAGVRLSLWPAGSSIVRDLLRRDIAGTHVVATDTDLSADSRDRFLIDGKYYGVNGVEVYSNSAVTSETLYLHSVTSRTA